MISLAQATLAVFVAHHVPVPALKWMLLLASAQALQVNHQSLNANKKLEPLLNYCEFSWKKENRLLSTLSQLNRSLKVWWQQKSIGC